MFCGLVMFWSAKIRTDFLLNYHLTKTSQVLSAVIYQKKKKSIEFCLNRIFERSYSPTLDAVDGDKG